MVKLVVLDLDDTLIHEGFELEKLGQSIVFEQTVPVLEYLKSKGYLLAIASRNYQAHRYLEFLDLRKYFDYVCGHFTETASKRYHFECIYQYFGIEYGEWSFFDDVEEYIDEANALGIRAKLVDWSSGITLEDVLTCGL